MRIRYKKIDNDDVEGKYILIGFSLDVLTDLLIAVAIIYFSL
jgi:hypothetical protein